MSWGSRARSPPAGHAPAAEVIRALVTAPRTSVRRCADSGPADPGLRADRRAGARSRWLPLSLSVMPIANVAGCPCRGGPSCRHRQVALLVAVRPDPEVAQVQHQPGALSLQQLMDTLDHIQPTPGSVPVPGNNDAPRRCQGRPRPGCLGHTRKVLPGRPTRGLAPQSERRDWRARQPARPELDGSPDPPRCPTAGVSTPAPRRSRPAEEAEEPGRSRPRPDC